MVTKHKFWINTSFLVVIWIDGLVRELYCLKIKTSAGVGLVLFHYALKDDPCLLIQPCDKKQRCLELVGELAAVFPKFVAHLVPINDDYGRYVFHNHPPDIFDGILSELNNPGHDECTQRHFYQFLETNRMEKDRGIYLADSDYSFTGAWGEEDVQAGINAACAVVWSIGRTLAPFNPLDCLLSK